MAILIVHLCLNRADVKSFKSRQIAFLKEIEKGRRPEQISSNGTVFFLNTPEKAVDFATRIITKCSMDINKDRLTVIDVGRGKAYIAGDFDAEIKAKFPLLIQQCYVS